MARRQPEGALKDECLKIAKEEGLILWQIEGKSRNGVPDTIAGRVAGGVVFLEFKQGLKLPTEQQWLRIYELREAGQEAWWCRSVDEYRRIVGLDPGGYRVMYPEGIKRLIAMKTKADDL